MEVTINYNGQAVAVEVTLEVYEFLDRADHKTENLFHEQRRHWDGREFDEYIITTDVYKRQTECRYIEKAQASGYCPKESRRTGKTDLQNL